MNLINKLELCAPKPGRTQSPKPLAATLKTTHNKRQMTIKKILVILNIAGLLVSLVWLYNQRELEPLITSIGLVATLIAQLFADINNNSDNVTMKQKGGKGSKNYQSKGDININIKNDK
jgi:hypothetical protein